MWRDTDRHPADSSAQSPEVVRHGSARLLLINAAAPDAMPSLDTALELLQGDLLARRIVLRVPVVPEALGAPVVD